MKNKCKNKKLTFCEGKNMEKEAQLQEAQRNLDAVSQNLAELRRQYEHLSTQQASLLKVCAIYILIIFSCWELIYMFL